MHHLRKACSIVTSDVVAPGSRRGPGRSRAGERKHSGSRELLLNLTMREVRSQFKRTALGRLWSFINPLATIAIYSIVFGFILRSPIEPGVNSGIHLFAFFLATALIPWSFMSGAIMAGMGSIVGNSGLLTKVYFPRVILPVSTILAMTVTFAIELSLLTAIMAVVGGPEVLLFLPGLIAMMALTVIFCIGIALMLSIAMVYFRDTQHFMNIFIQLWFYATPIIYAPTLIVQLQETVRNDGWTLFGEPFPLFMLYNLNPSTRITGAFRSMLYDFQWPSWQDWAVVTVWAGAVLGLGLLVFRRFSARVVEEL
ncbi:ABC transporter permease [Nakamurella leprariae]|uniref:Transport permease protein n=1 Tax=Nakamurella leprariae TaxID=2803911 RepID=A0A939C203_9ACTN|nr:ABC transporter permease [Nakamurella leprariae]MBM9467709.1 ABC transporter permease [Nakamurella leprariae]